MNQLIERYVSLAINHGERILSGDSKDANRIHLKLTNAIEDIKNSSSQVKKEFYNLLTHENDSVKIWTAVTLLKTFESKSIEILQSVSCRNNIFGLSAKTSIDCWKKGLMNNITDWHKS
tara:strand:- start:589 stop:945 length:357 start_codon:yes stop_codon:yes gene_type:complete